MSPSRLLAMLRAALSFTSISSRRALIAVEPLGGGAAAAAQLRHVIHKLEQLVAHGLDLILAEASLQRIDARLDCRELPFKRRRNAPPRGAPPRSPPGGAPLPFPRGGAPRPPRPAARLGEIGEANGLRLVRYAPPLFRRFTAPAAPRLGRGLGLRLPPRLRHLGLAPRFGNFRLAACGLGRLGKATRLRHLRLMPRASALSLPRAPRHLGLPPRLRRLGFALRLGQFALPPRLRQLGLTPRLDYLGMPTRVSEIACRRRSSAARLGLALALRCDLGRSAPPRLRQDGATRRAAPEDRRPTASASRAAASDSAATSRGSADDGASAAARRRHAAAGACSTLQAAPQAGPGCGRRSRAPRLPPLRFRLGPAVGLRCLGTRAHRGSAARSPPAPPTASARQGPARRRSSPRRRDRAARRCAGDFRGRQRHPPVVVDTGVEQIVGSALVASLAGSSPLSAEALSAFAPQKVRAIIGAPQART